MARQENSTARVKAHPVILGFTAICLLTIGPAVWHGRFANRWEIPPELLAAATTIDGFPKNLGARHASGDRVPLSQDVITELGVAGYIQRVYKRRDSEEVVALLLMVGYPGRLVRHTPDICYGNLANTLLGERRTSPIDDSRGNNGAASEFRVLDYRPQSQLREPFSVAYGFSTGAEWAAPGWPRITYSTSPLVYKAQIQASRLSESRKSGTPPIEDFLRAFVQGFAEFQRTRSGTKK